MADGFKFSKRLTSDTDELVIRAQVEDAGGGAWHAATFEKSRIDYITEVSEGVSGIALKTGAKIAVAMPYEELERKIYFSAAREEAVLDLRDKTGAAVKDARVPEPAKDFAQAAPKTGDKAAEKLPLSDKPLKIGVFVRQTSQQNFQMFVFTDSNIDWGKVSGENGLNGPIIKLPLRYGKGPFGETELIVDIPRAAFMEIYNKAKLDGQDELDLRELTRRRDPDKTFKGLNPG